jgi:hypothetical protein
MQLDAYDDDELAQRNNIPFRSRLYDTPAGHHHHRLRIPLTHSLSLALLSSGETVPMTEFPYYFISS